MWNNPQIAVLAIAIALIGKNCFSSHRTTQIGIAQSPTSNPCSVVPNSVVDGDTLRVNCDGKELKIRLCGIDAPETNQEMGIESRDYLRSLIARGNGQIIVVPIEKDHYSRTVAELFVPLENQQEIHLNSQMTLDGYAWHYAQYSGNCPSQQLIAHGQAIAKKNHLGLWRKVGNPTPPWEWRRNNHQ